MADDRIVVLTDQLNRLQGFFPRVEGRATFLAAVVIAQLGIIAVNFPIKAPLTFSGTIAGFAIGFMSASLVQVFRTLFPHLEPAPRPSLLYFGDIAQRRELDFVREVKASSDAELVDDLASQIWRNSEILTMKFRRIKWAFYFAACALPPWLIFLTLVVVDTGQLPEFGI